MRIAFDHQAFVLQSYGGISRYFCRLAAELSSMGEELQIFVPWHRNNYIRDLGPGLVTGRFFGRFPPKATGLIMYANGLRTARMVTGWAPDVVHATYYSARSHGSAKHPTVVTVHDMIHELRPEEFPWWDGTANAKLRAVRRAEGIICVSEHTRRDLIGLLGLDGENVRVVHHGFDRLPAQADGQTDREGRRPYLLYVGDRARYKNFSGMLRAIARSPRLMRDFDIHAFGGRPFSTDEKALIASLRFGNCRILHRSGNDSALGAAYSGASALIYPSLYEGFGMPPLEAMALGCPVVSSNTSSMPEVIGDAGEFFDPLAEEDVRRAIEAVVYSAGLSEELRRRGYARILKFSWRNCARETLRVYQSLS